VANFVNEFAWFYKRRGARVSSGTPWADVIGSSVPADTFVRMADGDFTDLIGSFDLTATPAVGNAAGPGGVGGAAVFNGTGAASFLSRSDAGLPAGQGIGTPYAISAALWLYRAAAGAGAFNIFLNWGSQVNSQSVYLYSTSGNQLGIDLYSVNAIDPTPTGSDVWRHVAFTGVKSGANDGKATWKLYVDGDLVATESLDTNTVLGGAGKFCVGRANDASTGCKGGACDLVIYNGGENTVWSGAQVLELYNDGVPFM
jgi:hypothetical protein